MLQENIDNSMKSGKYMKNDKFNKETEITHTAEDPIRKGSALAS